MAAPATVEKRFAFEGKDYILIFDWEAIAAFEDETDLSIFDVVAPPGGGSPKLSTMGSMLKAGLSQHHPDLTRSQAMAMLVSPDVQKLFNEGMTAMMPAQDDMEQEEGEGNPPASRKPRAKKRGAGKTS